MKIKSCNKKKKQTEKCALTLLHTTLPPYTFLENIFITNCLKSF